jgi:hypothetical protein
MRALLDVNVLISLFDTAHASNPVAIRWWLANRAHGWASCPLTQIGFLRIVTQKSYPRPVPLPDAMSKLTLQIAEPGHKFWADDFSLLDGTRIDRSRILASGHLTDIYLLALAVRNGGRLVTFDRGIPLGAVQGAAPKHYVRL